MRNSQNGTSGGSEGITFKAKHSFNPLEAFKVVSVNLAFFVFFGFATKHFVDQSEMNFRRR